MLGGSLVRIHVSLYHGRFWLVRQHRKIMPTGLRFASATEKNIHLLWPRRTERENLVVSYCKLQIILNSAAAHTSLTLLAMDARQACLRPSENCTFLCRLHGRLCARFKYSQTASKTNPAGTTPTEFFFWVLFLLDWSFLICSLQIYLQPGLVKLFLYSPEDYSLAAVFFFFNLQV